MDTLKTKAGSGKKKAFWKDEEFRAKFLETLMEKKQVAEESLAHLKEKKEEYKGSFSADDCIEEFDQAEREMRVQKYYRMLERKNEELEKIEILLHRIYKDEEFGRCEECGKRIPAERLMIVPEASTCVPCQRELERLASRKSSSQSSYFTPSRRKGFSWDDNETSSDEEDLSIKPDIEHLSILDLEETDLEENGLHDNVN